MEELRTITSMSQLVEPFLVIFTENELVENEHQQRPAELRTTTRIS